MKMRELPLPKIPLLKIRMVDDSDECLVDIFGIKRYVVWFPLGNMLHTRWGEGRFVAGQSHVEERCERQRIAVNIRLCLSSAKGGRGELFVAGTSLDGHVADSNR